jgi:uncharacterized protein with PQ loop repeat
MKGKQKPKKLIHNGQTPVDSMVYLALISPIMTLPQLYNIWKGDSGGVSLITWAAYLCVATLWLGYGLRHNLKPVVTVQIAWILIDIAIVLGLLIKN